MWTTLALSSTEEAHARGQGCSWLLNMKHYKRPYTLRCTHACKGFYTDLRLSRNTRAHTLKRINYVCLQWPWTVAAWTEVSLATLIIGLRGGTEYASSCSSAAGPIWKHCRFLCHKASNKESSMHKKPSCSAVMRYSSMPGVERLILHSSMFNIH